MQVFLSRQDAFPLLSFSSSRQKGFSAACKLLQVQAGPSPTPFCHFGRYCLTFSMTEKKWQTYPIRGTHVFSKVFHVGFLWFSK